MKQTIRLLSWNVNGIRAAAKKGLLEWLLRASPDILCIQETKAETSQLSREILEPAGYRSYWSSARKKGYSGVGVYSRIEPMSVDLSLGVPRFDEEGRVIRLDFPNFTLFNVYFPNGKSGTERLLFKMDFYAAFIEYLEDLRKRTPRLIFTGDVNTAHRQIDLARPKENEKVSGFLPEERAWIDSVISRGYTDTFRFLNPDAIQYSWWDLKSRERERNVGWRIDYVFVSEEMLSSVTKAFILGDVLGSDHCPVGIEFEA
jgi:exodeoxyribonuclease III